MKTRPNFKKARKLASEVLLMQKDPIIPINPFLINLNNCKVTIKSFQECSNKMKVPPDDYTFDGIANDGYIKFNVKPNHHFILYNSDIESKGRIKWTIAHELGHIVLDHKEQNEANEIEADTFASQLLCPQCVVKKLFDNNVKININYIINKFGLSNAAAKSCLRLIGKKGDSPYSAIYDDIILSIFKPFVDNETKNDSISTCCDDDLMDNIRNIWLYDK